MKKEICSLDKGCNCNIISECVSVGSFKPITPLQFPAVIQPIQIGHISLDLSSLCSPKVLLTFSGEMVSSNFPFLNGSFRVVRICNGVSTEIATGLGNGIFSTFAVESFSYQVCDCNCSCNDCDCVTYSFELLIEPLAPGITFNLNNLFITAFAAEKECKEFICEKGNNFTIASTFFQIIPPTTSIGSISVDVCNIKNPKILLTFSGDISTFLIAPPFSSYFRIIRTCNGISEELPFKFSALILGAVIFQEMSEAFAYQFCDKDLSCCDGCITYSVEFVTNSFIIPNTNFSISNVVLSAFVNDDCN